MSKRLHEYGISIGRHDPGPKNSIADVGCIRVGHVTLNDQTVKTGLTIILPCTDSIFRQKMICGATIFNGFGKSIGLVQVDELGTLETPIVLTNTLSVGDAARGVVQHMLASDPDIGLTAGTVNPVVFECNDSYLNDIRGLHIRPEHVSDAIAAASQNVAEGSVGAGTGMSAYHLKGGIGTASRIARIFGKPYVVGCLVLTNMGKRQDLVIDGRQIGRLLAQQAESNTPEVDQGSIIMIIATDAPLSSRQLKRVSSRCIIGLSRTGSHMGQGSGEIAFGFSIANRIPHCADQLIKMEFIPDDQLDPIFESAIESVEEAILNAMVAAEDTVGRDGHARSSLANSIEALLR